MLAPEDDLEARRPLWDLMQMFWMDTDLAREVAATAQACADSKYTVAELKRIFLNEVRPAVSFNLVSGPAPEWAGFESGWLVARILKVHRFHKRLPMKLLHPYAYKWWGELERDIMRRRAGTPLH